jgi:alpha-tubulin suppressor-like RCC1 family protein
VSGVDGSAGGTEATLVGAATSVASVPPSEPSTPLTDDDRASAFAMVAAELAWEDAGDSSERAPSRRRYALAGGALLGVAALVLAAATLQRGPEQHARPGRVVPPTKAALADTSFSLLPPIVTPSQSAKDPPTDSVSDAVIDSIVRADTQSAAPKFPVKPQAATTHQKTVNEPTPPAKTVKEAPSPSKAVKDPASASPPPAPAPTPAATVSAPAPSSRVTVVAGGVHTCLVGTDGRAFCWGGNDRGQVGNGGTLRTISPSIVSPDVRFSTIAAGLSHSCGLARGTGIAWCWGDNDQGQLGDRTIAPRATPVRAADGQAFASIFVGAAHTCGLQSDGEAWCWGSNVHGQVGGGDLASPGISAPGLVAGGHRWSAVSTGWNFTCGVERGGRAYCWGENASGEVGDGTTTERRSPVAVSTDVSFATIAAGNAHACGITTQGEAYCWGENSSGQLGDGSRVDRRSPVKVKTSVRLMAIATGAVHTCALATDGEAYCWGRNTYGQLGDGTMTDEAQPVKVAGGHAFASLRTFGSHTCASTLSGEAFCWGYNLDGQLGDGTRVHRTRPVYIEPPPGG